MDDSFKIAGVVVQSFISVNRALTGFTQRNAASLGLTVPQMGVLNAIYAKMGSTLKEITERLQMPKSTASIITDELVKSELVERRAAEDDRREISLRITEKGERLARESVANSTSYRAMQWALAEMREEEIQAVLDFHDSLLGKLKEYEASSFQP